MVSMDCNASKNAASFAKQHRTVIRLLVRVTVDVEAWRGHDCLEGQYYHTLR